MIIFFYLLMALQIALGLYSLWDGFAWIGMVRRRLGTHAGFYAPVTALICPCKGIEPGLEENLTALTRFDYPAYDIYIALATSLDPALKIIERVKASSQRRVHIVIAGPPEDCSEKVFNLRRAVGEVPDQFEVLVFTDSDVRLSRSWLGKLVAPLQDPRIGATTCYRWFIPSGRFGKGGFASALVSAWNAAIVTMLGRHDNFCWGGGTAIRRKTFDEAHVLNAWDGAVSDDFAMTRALEETGKSVMFCPECLAATVHPWTISGMIEFTNRQISITRVYSPRRWTLGATAHIGYSFTLIYAAVTILTTMAGSDPWVQLALVALVIPLLAMLKGAIRTVAIAEMLPEWKKKLNESSWAWTLLAPFVPFLFTWNFLASLMSRRIRWRGIRYEMLSPEKTRILKR